MGHGFRGVCPVCSGRTHPTRCVTKEFVRFLADRKQRKTALAKGQCCCEFNGMV